MTNYTAILTEVPTEALVLEVGRRTAEAHNVHSFGQFGAIVRIGDQLTAIRHILETKRNQPARRDVRAAFHAIVVNAAYAVYTSLPKTDEPATAI